MWIVPEAFHLGKLWELLPLTSLGRINGSSHGVAAEFLVVARGSAQRGAHGDSRCDTDIGKQRQQTKVFSQKVVTIDSNVNSPPPSDNCTVQLSIPLGSSSSPCIDQS